MRADEGAATGTGCGQQLAPVRRRAATVEPPAEREAIALSTKVLLRVEACCDHYGRTFDPRLSGPVAARATLVRAHRKTTA